MKFYRTKPKVKPAIQFIAPSEMPFPFTGWDPRPEFKEIVFWHNSKPRVDTVLYGQVELKSGDWLVPSGVDKQYKVYSHVDFKDQFEPVDPSETLQ
jgi:hypothetical protein